MKNKGYQPSDFDIKQMEFELFCKVRNWQMWHFDVNKKNKKQNIGYALTDTGDEAIFLISENSRYYRFKEPKVWEPYEYVLKKE